MYYKVEIDYVDINDNLNNPRFYLRDNELNTFIKMCSVNGYKVIVLEVPESEYVNNIATIE